MSEHTSGPLPPTLTNPAIGAHLPKNKKDKLDKPEG